MFATNPRVSPFAQYPSHFRDAGRIVIALGFNGMSSPITNIDGDTERSEAIEKMVGPTQRRIPIGKRILNGAIDYFAEHLHAGKIHQPMAEVY
jgi:CBS domain-containing protein